MNEARICCFLSPREQVLASDLSPVDSTPAVVCFSQKGDLGMLAALYQVVPL